MKTNTFFLSTLSKSFTLALFLAVILSGCDDENDKKKKAQPQIEVNALKIVRQDMPVISRFVGKTTSVSKVEIRARVSGFLEKCLYKEGTMVKKGQNLFEMDQKPFRAQLKNSHAALEAQLAALEYAKVHLERTQSMVKENVTARKELDFAMSNYQTALAGVEQARSNVVQDELELGYTVIASPIDGLSSFADQEEGAYIGMGGNSLLTYVAKLDPMRVEFSVSENQILKAHEQERKGLLKEAIKKTVAEIELADGTVYPHRGEVTFADASLSETTGTFLVRAQVPNPNHNLRPGQFVRVLLHGAFRPDAIAVPQKAVQENAKGSFVWVVGNDMIAKLQPVTLGDWYGKENWFINDGLEAGDIVVVDGVSKLVEGVKVVVSEYLEIKLNEDIDAEKDVAAN